MKKRVIEIDAGLIARDEEDSKYEHVQKPVEKDFEGYGIENPGFAFGDDPNFEEDGEYSDNYDDDNYEAPKSEFFFGETPPEVVAKEKAEAEAAAAAAIAAEKAAKEEAEALDAAKDAVEETVEEVAAEEETTEEISEASEAEEDETYENYSALIEEEDDGESDIIPEDEPAEDESAEEDEKEEDKNEEKKDPSDFVFNDDDKKVEETKEEKKEDAKEEAEEDKNDDWIEEVSLNDIDLDIQEDDD